MTLSYINIAYVAMSLPFQRICQSGHMRLIPVIDFIHIFEIYLFYLRNLQNPKFCTWVVFFLDFESIIILAEYLKKLIKPNLWSRIENVIHAILQGILGKKLPWSQILYNRFLEDMFESQTVHLLRQQIPHFLTSPNKLAISFVHYRNFA